jgi:hypothetical protein
MNNNNSTRRRIDAREFAQKLCCHPVSVKRRIRKPPPGFPKPALLLGKWTWAEDEADRYVELLIEQSR